MKRWTLRIFFYLILGAVTTVGVAWGIAVGGNWRSFDWLPFHEDGGYGYGFVQMRHRFGGVGCLARFEGVTIRERFSRWVSRQPVPRSVRPRLSWKGDHGSWEAAAFGWPISALRYESWCGTTPSGYAGSWTIRGAVQVVRPRGPGHLAGKAPLLPIWPGSVLDTLFYGAICFGLFFGIGFGSGAARRTIRRRRGRCPMCAYDLRRDFDSGCPECGWNRLSRAG